MPRKLSDAVLKRTVERTVTAGNRWDSRRREELEARRVELEGSRVELDRRMGDVSERISRTARSSGTPLPRKLKDEWDTLVSELRTLTAEVAGIDESLRFHKMAQLV